MLLPTNGTDPIAGRRPLIHCPSLPRTNSGPPSAALTTHMVTGISFAAACPWRNTTRRSQLRFSARVTPPARLRAEIFLGRIAEYKDEQGVGARPEYCAD